MWNSENYRRFVAERDERVRRVVGGEELVGLDMLYEAMEDGWVDRINGCRVDDEVLAEVYNGEVEDCEGYVVRIENGVVVDDGE